MTSYSLVPARTFRFARVQLVELFKTQLNSVDRYEWRFVPKGSRLVEYDNKPSLLADVDYIEIQAFGS